MSRFFTLSSSRYRLIFSAAFCTALLAIIAGANWYFLVELERKTALLAEVKSAVASFELRRRTLFRERSFLIEVGEDVNKIDSVFIDSENPIAFIEKLEGAARNRGLRLKLSAPQKRTGTFMVGIDTVGRFSAVTDFLKDVEAFKEQGVVESLSFERLSSSVEKEVIGQTQNIQVRVLSEIEFLAK
ncbi:MAG: hypothetical protein HYW90_00820 [Candidatus Sungbacteria bacterium]|nr:hypothetical protein [Candidatus Sungbacteria bacterium]